MGFDEAMKFIARWEWGDREDGGYTNDPIDPGGETKFGISKRAHPNEDIKNLTLDRATEIYRSDYWNALRCDNWPRDFAIVCFDSAVNCGVARVLVWLDGALTTQDVLDCRRNYYQDLVTRKPTLKKYLKGWLNRLDALIEYIRKIESHTTQ